MRQVEPDNGKWVAWGFIGTMLAIVVAIVIMAMCSGCANIHPKFGDNQMLTDLETSKFLADARYKERIKFGPDGKTIIEIEREYETSTNADKIMGAATELFGTLVNGASKVMP
jgi:hypothetical protein